MEGLSSASVLWEMKLQQAAHTAAWVIPCRNSNGSTSHGHVMKEM